MTKTSVPIVFFGSGPVAAKSLQLLVADFSIEAIVTKPRAPHHKGSVPVLELAEERGLPTYTVSSKKELDALVSTRPFQAEVAILIDFGIIVSQAAIDYFPFGIINSHFSLLPQWRGADPLTFSILSGQQQTGVSLMLLSAAMDEGPLLAQTPYDMPPTMTTPELTDILIEASYEALKHIVPQYMQHTIDPAPQENVTLADSTIPTYSRKLTKQDSILDWSKPAIALEREIRAFIEWPKSRATLNGIDVIITKAHVVDKSGKPGTTTIIEKLPAIFCGEQALAIDAIKPAGKKEMTGEGFLAGYKHTFLG